MEGCASERTDSTLLNVANSRRTPDVGVAIPLSLPSRLPRRVKNDDASGKERRGEAHADAPVGRTLVGELSIRGFELPDPFRGKRRTVCPTPLQPPCVLFRRSECADRGSLLSLSFSFLFYLLADALVRSRGSKLPRSVPDGRRAGADRYRRRRTDVVSHVSSPETSRPCQPRARTRTRAPLHAVHRLARFVLYATVTRHRRIHQLLPSVGQPRNASIIVGAITRRVLTSKSGGTAGKSCGTGGSAYCISGMYINGENPNFSGLAR